MNFDNLLYEPFTPFSKSIIWELQRNFFNNEGIQAWNGQVPFYVSSNKLIANHYTHIISSFIQDLSLKNQEFKSPIHIIELGAGSGKFSFHLIKQLFNILKDLNWTNNIKYIISDVSQKNIDHLKNHSQLETFFQQGILDIGILDLESSSDTIKLQYSEQELHMSQIDAPVCLIGNYVLDSIKNDCFQIKNNELHNMLIQTRLQKPLLNGHPPNITDCTFDFEPIKIPTDYYSHPKFNRILSNYVNNISNSSILFPISFLNFLDRMFLNNQHPLLFLCGDKGHAKLLELDYISAPHISSHGSISLMTNFHAISHFFELNNGFSIDQKLSQSFKTQLFYKGDTPINYTKQMYNALFNGLNPGNFLPLKNELKINKDNLTLDTIFSLIETSYFDPDIYYDFHNAITNKLSKATHRQLNNLEIILDTVTDNFFSLPFGTNILSSLANNYYILAKYEKALQLYNKSLFYFEADYNILFNMALCHFSLNDFHQSFALFKQAQIKSNTEKVADWIQKCINNDTSLIG